MKKVIFSIRNAFCENYNLHFVKMTNFLPLLGSIIFFSAKNLSRWRVSGKNNFIPLIWQKFVKKSMIIEKILVYQLQDDSLRNFLLFKKIFGIFSFLTIFIILSLCTYPKNHRTNRNLKFKLKHKIIRNDWKTKMEKLAKNKQNKLSCTDSCITQRILVGIHMIPSK